MQADVIGHESCYEWLQPCRGPDPAPVPVAVCGCRPFTCGCWGMWPSCCPGWPVTRGPCAEPCASSPPSTCSWPRPAHRWEGDHGGWKSEGGAGRGASALIAPSAWLHCRLAADGAGHRVLNLPTPWHLSQMHVLPDASAPRCMPFQMHDRLGACLCATCCRSGHQDGGVPGSTQG